MERLKGKTAIITGGAGGIGLAAVRLFRASGAEVIIADIDESAGAEAAAETGARFVKCDVSQSEDVRTVIDACGGKLDVLYNNAGVFWNGRDGRITDIEEGIWEKVIAINLRSVFLFCKYAIPLLIKQGGMIKIENPWFPGKCQINYSDGKKESFADRICVLTMDKNLCAELVKE